jgi:hypothetical protein
MVLLPGAHTRRGERARESSQSSFLGRVQDPTHYSLDTLGAHHTGNSGLGPRKSVRRWLTRRILEIERGTVEAIQGPDPRCQVVSRPHVNPIGLLRSLGAQGKVDASGSPLVPHSTDAQPHRPRKGLLGEKMGQISCLALRSSLRGLSSSKRTACGERSGSLRVSLKSTPQERSGIGLRQCTKEHRGSHRKSAQGGPLSRRQRSSRRPLLLVIPPRGSRTQPFLSSMIPAKKGGGPRSTTKRPKPHGKLQGRRGGGGNVHQEAKTALLRPLVDRPGPHMVNQRLLTCTHTSTGEP